MVKGSAVGSAWKMLLGFGVAVVIAAILFPIFAQAKMGSGDRGRCLNRVRTVIRDLKLYADDNDDALPAASEWMDKIVNLDPFIDPNLHDRSTLPAADYGYAYRDKASGITESSIATPKIFALVFDSTMLQRNAHSEPTTLPKPGRHYGRNTIGFLDGHTKGLPMP